MRQCPAFCVKVGLRPEKIRAHTADTPHADRSVMSVTSGRLPYRIGPTTVPSPRDTYTDVVGASTWPLRYLVP